MEQQIRFCNTPDGARIAYATLGQGPALIIPPAGWVSHLELMWEWLSLRKFYERLATNHTVVQYDMLGTGLSDRDHTDFSLERRLQMLEAVVDHLNLSQLAFLALVHDGPTAIAYTVKHNTEVTHLILFGCYSCGYDIANEKTKSSILSMIRDNWKLGSRALADFSLPNAEPVDVKAFNKLLFEGATPEIASDIMKANYQLDVTDLLPGINVPTLVMHRRRDRIIPFRLGRELAASIPNAHFVPLEGNDQVPWIGDSDSVLRAINEFLGDPVTTESGRVLVTLLFTDIVGSTEKAAELGDSRWKDLLERHNELVREELARFQGREVDAVGDGFLATFDRPTQGVQCASAISDSVRQLGIDIRAGLHMGECETVGNAVRGIAVHIGARVAEKADPGEVLVSSTVKDLLAGSDIRLQDRGTQALKGVPEEWRLFAVERSSVF